MVLGTLRAMALGGMRDHVGGGFHRYSVDGGWRVPHFEKMLYDQAQLVLALLEAWQLSGDAFFAQVAEDTLRYVARDLTSPDGGFYSAEDADSIPPAQAGQAGAHPSEGAFYIWSRDEIVQVLGPDAPAWERRFGVLPGGNAPFDPQGEFGVHNLFYTARTIADVASDTGLAPVAVGEALARARQRLFEARRARPRPLRDEKVLTAWNGLMIAAFARAARVLDVPGALGEGQAGDGGPPPGRRSTLRAFPAQHAVGRGGGTAQAPLRGRGRRNRGLRRRLRLPGVGPAGALPGRRRSGVAGVGADAARLARTPLRSARRRRLVRDDWRGPVGAVAPGRGVRRRRAVGDVGRGDEPAGAGAADRRRRLPGARRSRSCGPGADACAGSHGSRR